MNINDKIYMNIVYDILTNSNYKKLNNINHHGISRMEHLLKVSYCSYKIAKKFNFDYVSTSRGALLHDFYLDGNERCLKRKFLDTFIHPKKALETSCRIFNTNKLEEDIIISHMFPIYLKVPKYKESVLVNLVDKVIGFKELSMEYFDLVKYRLSYGYLLITLFMNC